jgi:hypothetical protein
MGMRLVQVIYAIFIYIFIGTSLAMAFVLNRHYPTWLFYILGIGSLLALKLVSEHFRSSNLKLFGKIDVRIIGTIAYICSSVWILQLFYL